LWPRERHPLVTTAKLGSLRTEVLVAATAKLLPQGKAQGTVAGVSAGTTIAGALSSAVKNLS
jgi:hypothetical protein